MTADGKTDRAGDHFDYSEGEWREIADEVRPHVGEIPEAFRRRLLQAASMYTRLVREQQQPTYRPPTERAKVYNKLARLARDLAAALRESEDPECPIFTIRDYYEPPQVGMIRERLRAAGLREAIARRACDNPTVQLMDQIAPLERVEIHEAAVEHEWSLHILDSWASTAEALAEINSGARLIIDSISSVPYGVREHERPRRVYYEALLRAWKSIGGNLGTSRDPFSGEVNGPLVRFFRAATVPVMGAAAPASETIRDIVSRFKKQHNSGQARDPCKVIPIK